MKRRRFVGIFFLILVTFLLLPVARGMLPPPLGTAGNSLRYLAQNRGIEIGAAVNLKPLREEPKYGKVLAREFNLLTAENVMKFGPLRPTRDRFDFTDADYLIAFAERHNMRVRGHTLVWHRALPEWLEKGNFTRDELISILREYIYRVVSHFRGRVFAWDVVNEAIADDGSLRDSFWLQNIGPEYIEMAFRWAREADPQVQLFYNDYGGEGLGTKSDAIYNLVKELKAKGVPIDGVGLQMHVSLNTSPPPPDVTENINRLAALGIEVNITEMDVQTHKSAETEEEKLAAQAKIYGDMLRVCLAAKNCKAFVLWGFTDRYSWIPYETGNQDIPLIFDKSYRPKPAYDTLKQTLKNFRVEA